MPDIGSRPKLSTPLNPTSCVPVMNSIRYIFVFLAGLSIGIIISSTIGLMNSNCNNNILTEPTRTTNCPPPPPPPQITIPITENIRISKVSNSDGDDNDDDTKPCQKKTSAFDQMNERLYNIANEAPPNNNHRKQYTLGSVKNAGGGLHDPDRTLLADLYHKASSVFEYGLGESTHIAAYVGVPRLAGVDSDANWVAKARDGSVDHFRFAFADVGALGPRYGQPKNESLKKIPYDYQSGPLNNEMSAFDLYLVDGRYRVATACASFLHAMSRGGDMKEVMVLVFY